MSLAAAFGIWVTWRNQSPRRAAFPGNIRFVEARISGLPWAPFRPQTSSQHKPAEASVVRGEVPPPPEVRSEDVRLELLANRPERAIPTLRALAGASSDATVWNDLAAAYFAAGRWADALSAVDQSLLFDPTLAEALFNRALILERFHLRESSMEAWRTYLSSAATDGWREEAAGHLRDLERPRPTFASEIEVQYGRLENGNRAVAGELIRLDAGEARLFGELQGLGRWGEAWLRRDEPAAQRHLTATRTLATELEAIHGEALLLDSVEAISRADRAQSDALARAHVSVRDGRIAYEQRRLADSEKMLDSAAQRLESAHSPYVVQARLFAATAKYWQGRRADAEAEYRAIAPLVPDRYAALRAQLEWQWAAVALNDAETGNATTHLSRAIEIFSRLGEHHHVGYLQNMIAQTYAGAHDDTRAAEHRELALRELGMTSDARLVHALNGMAYDALEREDWRAARSFLNLQLGVNEHAGDAELQITALLRRARAHAHLGDQTAAQADLRMAESVVLGVKDDSHRGKLRMDCDVATALISDDPALAIPLLTAALTSVDEKGTRLLLPELYLRRGRMFLALGDHARAAADFESGISGVETNRATIEKGEARWGILDSAQELFDAAITESLRTGAAPAFAYAERKRARSLADVVAERFQHDRLPNDAVVIEYAALRDQLLIFTVDRRGIRVDRSPIARTELTTLAERFANSLRNGDTAEHRRVATKLHERLVAPVAEAIAGHREVAFITDAFTSGIPFAALPSGPGRTLVEDVTISVAPSARVYLASRTRGSRPRTNVLIVDSPVNEALPRLPATSAEARALQAQYPEAERLTGGDATRDAFVAAATRSNVIHFGGHGLASVDSAALVLTATASDAGFFDATAISRLQLPQTDVVVLAACDTARGPIRSAEGVLSVTHAFMQAGAPAVISTLWPLDDRDAADFFPRVHRQLARGLPAAEALRLAQLEMIRSSPADRSAVWAAVQVAGY